MSANEKDLRTARQAERKEKKTAAAAEQEKKERRYRRNAIIVIAILVVVIAFALLVNSDYFYTHTTALTVGGTKYSPAEVNYFFRNIYNNLYQSLSSQLGDSANAMLDNSTPLNKQLYPYSDDGKTTWADIIMLSTTEEMKRVTALADAADKAGYTLTAEDRSSVDSSIDVIKQYAAGSGFPNPDKFLAAYYGKGMDLKTYTKLMERVTLASSYSEALENSFTYSSDDLAAYYSEHAEELDYYDYYIYTVSDSMEQFSDVPDEEKAEKIHAAAEEIVNAAADADAFVDAVKAFTGENTHLNVSTFRASTLSSSYKDWMTDPSRQPGDTTVVDGDGVSYAIYFVGLDKNDYNTVDFRHILVKAEADEDGNYTEEALFAARAKAEDIFAQWRQNPTEENFAALANENSDDDGSNTTGGLYEKTTKYTMVPGVNNFLFNEGHVAGDAGVVLGESNSYTGYHVMYYVGDNARNCDLLAENAKRSADYSAKYEEITSGYEAAEGYGIRFINY